MLNFEYKGISAGKYVDGQIEALNNAEAADKLKKQKIHLSPDFLKSQKHGFSKIVQCFSQNLL